MRAIRRWRASTRGDCLFHLTSTDRLFDIIVCDASFISVTLLLSRWPALLAPGGQVLSLVKPNNTKLNEEY
jgi:predicted rRNA methylase YqxC with S4 and FtsJ domains